MPLTQTSSDPKINKGNPKSLLGQITQKGKDMTITTNAAKMQKEDADMFGGAAARSSAQGHGFEDTLATISDAGQKTIYGPMYAALMDLANKGGTYNKDVRDVLEKTKGKDKPGMDERIAEMAKLYATDPSYKRFTAEQLMETVQSNYAKDLFPSAEGGQRGADYYAKQVDQALKSGVSKEDLGVAKSGPELQKALKDGLIAQGVNPESPEGRTALTKAKTAYDETIKKNQTDAFTNLSQAAGAQRSTDWAKEKQRASNDRMRLYGPAGIAAAIVTAVFLPGIGIPALVDMARGAVENKQKGVTGGAAYSNILRHGAEGAIIGGVATGVNALAGGANPAGSLGATGAGLSTIAGAGKTGAGVVSGAMGLADKIGLGVGAAADYASNAEITSKEKEAANLKMTKDLQSNELAGQQQGLNESALKQSQGIDKMRLTSSFANKNIQGSPAAALQMKMQKQTQANQLAGQQIAKTGILQEGAYITDAKKAQDEINKAQLKQKITKGGAALVSSLLT